VKGRSLHGLIASILAVSGGLFAQGDFSVRIDSPASAVSGGIIESSARLTVPGDVLSWSVSWMAEGLEIIEATSAGTDLDQFAEKGFVESAVALDGGGFYSIGVLDFETPTALPGGTWDIVRTKAIVSLKEPGTARWLPADPLPGDPREIRNSALLPGGDVVPLAAAESTIEVAGCAEVLLVPRAAAGPIPVRRDTPIAIDIIVNVPSDRHLRPTGLELALLHDPALRLDLVEASPGAAALAAPDGAATIEIGETGLDASFRAAAGKSIGPGSHVVFTATYSFQAKVNGGSRVFTRIGPPEDAVRGGAELEPGAAAPCAVPESQLELIVDPDGWVRGDTNSDGIVDISDAITSLRGLFLGGEVLCARAMETNLDGQVDLTDSVYLLLHLFTGGEPLARPFPECGAAEEEIPCDVFVCPAT
jgi:hypothetical protein